MSRAANLFVSLLLVAVVLAPVIPRAQQPHPRTTATTQLVPLPGLQARYGVYLMGFKIGEVHARVLNAPSQRQQVEITGELHGVVAMFVTPMFSHTVTYPVVPGTSATEVLTMLGAGAELDRFELAIMADRKRATVVRTRGETFKHRDYHRSRAMWDAVAYADYLRHRPLYLGEYVLGDVFAGKHMWQTTLAVASHREIVTAAGSVDAIKLAGVAQRYGRTREQYQLALWLSDDAWRIPLKASMRLPVGSVEVSLLYASSHARQPGGVGRLSPGPRSVP